MKAIKHVSQRLFPACSPRGEAGRRARRLPSARARDESWRKNK